ncbi:MAG: hypothetical protein AAF945_08550 [Actinomycetota bacterium]
MSIEPFSQVRPADGDRHAWWVLASLVPPPAGGVAFRVPAGFDDIVRIHHPLHGDETWGSIDAVRDLRRESTLPSPLPDELVAVEGELDDVSVDALVPALRRATDTPDLVHFAQWTGWGDLHRGSQTTTVYSPDLEQWEVDRQTARRAASAEIVYSFVESCPQVEWWGGRTMFLFDGPVDAVATVGVGSIFDPGRLRRRCPQWWWPGDRSWFVATEIDDPCTYVAGDERLISDVESLGLDTVRVRATDRW